MTEEFRSLAAADFPDALFADGLDGAIIGVARRCGQPPLVAYSVTKCLEIFVAQGMTEEEAEEFFEFNVVGAWVGPNTPTFVYDALSAKDTYGPQLDEFGR